MVGRNRFHCYFYQMTLKSLWLELEVVARILPKWLTLMMVVKAYALVTIASTQPLSIIATELLLLVEARFQSMPKMLRFATNCRGTIFKIIIMLLTERTCVSEKRLGSKLRLCWVGVKSRL